MIEKHFDVPFIADLALREKQIQQNYRPPIAVHKWFARRPGTLFRGLILSEFVDRPLREAFYQNHDLAGRCVADPFMGGGTPLMEANRVGCDVIGCDINPMSYWIVRQEIEHLDLTAYRAAARSLTDALEREMGSSYRTQCLECGNPDAHVKYFLWVKVLPCEACQSEIRLFPGYLLAEDRRHPRNVVVCAACGSLTECESRDRPGPCRHCGQELRLEGPARRGRCVCPTCATPNAFPNPALGAPRHALFALEYHCPACRATHKGRFFKSPDAADLAMQKVVTDRLQRMRLRFVPDDVIPPGDESSRLHRWGYRRYREMFSNRQLQGLELSCRHIDAVQDERVRNALATNLSDLLRYQNMLCRYDAMALKSLDIFSVHGFPVGLIQCESNLLGIPAARAGGSVGSGGWSNIIEKFAKAKEYCDAPFEFRHEGAGKQRVLLPQEWIGDSANGNADRRPRRVTLRCGDAASGTLAAHSLDAVFTDPPYFGNVQYAELMDFCYVWLRKLVGSKDANGAFAASTTRAAAELTGNVSMGRDLAHFTEGMSSVFQRMAAALKPGAPLAFTYHHNDVRAYYPLAVAILDAGLTCSASLPCPAEMGASIHISGTGSSIIDTVFVCRSTGRIPRKWIADGPTGIAALVQEDLRKLRQAAVQPTLGDTRCILFGHLIRLAVWNLRKRWCATRPANERLSAVADWVDTRIGEALECVHRVGSADAQEPVQQSLALREVEENYGRKDRQISF